MEKPRREKEVKKLCSWNSSSSHGNALMASLARGASVCFFLPAWYSAFSSGPVPPHRVPLTRPRPAKALDEKESGLCRQTHLDSHPTLGVLGIVLCKLATFSDLQCSQLQNAVNKASFSGLLWPPASNMALKEPCLLVFTSSRPTTLGQSWSV